MSVVVPARDEAAQIETALRSLLAQDHPGLARVVLVDDGSGDGTGAIARAIGDQRLVVLDGAPRPPGWAGKLFAVAQGVAVCETELVLLTDADIVHAPSHLATLVAKLMADRLDMVSEMVALHRESLAERALVPAFVYFFQMLYPFAAVCDPQSPVAAAAGGTVLVRAAALERIGGIAGIRGALIDDVALGAAIKRGGPVWLGHSRLAASLRPYPRVGDIWAMVTRSAYVQLRFNPLLLVGTLVGMALLYVVPPAASLFGHGLARVVGLLTWVALTASFVPTLWRMGASLLWAPALPAVALVYAAATFASAVRHHTGRGVAWKGRAYRAATS